MCTICGSSKKKFIADLCSNMKIMGNNFPEEKSRIVCCEECGFVYSDFENIVQEDFDKYYLETSRTVRYEDIYGQEMPLKYYEHIYDVVSKYSNKGDNIIDIAAGYGEISEYFLSKGYSNVTVNEIKPECIEHIRSKKMKLLEKNVYALNEIEDKFDIAIVSHDLEHFTDINRAMSNILSVLNDDSYMLVEVPDVSMYEKLDRAPYHFLTYEHIGHFSDVTLQNIATRHGMEIVEMGHYIKCDDYPCVYALMRRTTNVIEKIERDIISEEEICKYVRRCKKDIAEIVDKYSKDNTPIILWGIGASTAQLLNGCFDNCNVVQLIDKNESKQGLEFVVGNKKLVIEKPELIKDQNSTILILSTAYKDLIKKDIINRGLKNQIEWL